MGEAKYQLPKRRNPKTGYKCFVLEGANKDLFTRLYPTTFNGDLAQLFGVSRALIQRFGHKLGLEKDAPVIEKKYRAKALKAMYESGYVASLKGRVPKHLADYVQKVKDGEINPYQVFLKNSTEEERQASAQRRLQKVQRLMREDRVRIKYGLPQKTKYHLAAEGHKRASWQKSSMIHYCNYFADPAHPNWVCYDKDTRRSAVREATAIRRGLEIVEGE